VKRAKSGNLQIKSWHAEILNMGFYFQYFKILVFLDFNL